MGTGDPTPPPTRIVADGYDLIAKPCRAWTRGNRVRLRFLDEVLAGWIPEAASSSSDAGIGERPYDVVVEVPSDCLPARTTERRKVLLIDASETLSGVRATVALRADANVVFVDNLARSDRLDVDDALLDEGARVPVGNR